MTPEGEALFRRFGRIIDFANDESPEVVVDAMARIASWSYRQTKAHDPSLDGLLEPLKQRTSLWMGLLLHLATIDFHFFLLARRMSAATITRVENPHLTYRKMAALLLVTEPPNRKRPKRASHVALVIGVAVSQQLGRRPTETGKKAGPRSNSGCAKMAEAMTALGAQLDYSGIEKVWTQRKMVLRSACFDEQDLLDFLRITSPMQF